MFSIGLLTATEKQVNLGRLHETHSVASQIQLEGTGITRKGHSYSQVSAPPSEIMAGGKQCALRPTITPNKTCTANLYRCIKRRMLCSLRAHRKRNWVPPRKQVAYKLSRTESGLFGPERVPRPLFKQDSACSYRQHHSGVTYKQGRRHEASPAVWPSMANLDLVHQKTSNTQSQHIPGCLNIVADKLYRLGQTIQSGLSFQRSSMHYAAGCTGLR